MLASQGVIAKIKAHGQPLNLGLGAKVLSFQYEDSEDEDDLFTIVFSDPYGQLVDSDQFQEGIEWRVQWGFSNHLYPARKVIVKRPRYSFGEVEINALDKGVLLKSKEHWGTFQKTNPKKVIEEIAQTHGLKHEVDDLGFSDVPFLALAGRSHYAILKYLQSRAQDHTFKVVGDTLKFQKRNLSAPPVARFDYSNRSDSQILSFDIQIKDQDNTKSATQTTAVTVDPFSHQTKTYSANEKANKTQNLGNERVDSDYQTKFLKNITRMIGLSILHENMPESTGKALPLPPKKPSEIKSIIQAKRSQALLNNVEANFEISASSQDSFLQSGDLISVSGIGKKFSGAYQISSITHDLNDGYKYNITAKRNALNARHQKPVNSFINGPINNKALVKTTVGSINKPIQNALSLNEFDLSER